MSGIVFSKKQSLLWINVFKECKDKNSPVGRKICNQGWTGSECDTMISGGDADCDVFEGMFML